MSDIYTLIYDLYEYINTALPCPLPIYTIPFPASYDTTCAQYYIWFRDGSRLGRRMRLFAGSCGKLRAAPFTVNRSLFSALRVHIAL